MVSHFRCTSHSLFRKGIRMWSRCPVEWNGMAGGLGCWFRMNARGTMEIILGLLALQYGVMRERMFVDLVVMALWSLP